MCSPPLGAVDAAVEECLQVVDSEVHQEPCSLAVARVSCGQALRQHLSQRGNFCQSNCCAESRRAECDCSNERKIHEKRTCAKIISSGGSISVTFR